MTTSSAAGDQRRFLRARQALIKRIEKQAQELPPPLGPLTLSRQVLESIAKLPREQFIPSAYQGLAYDDTPVPIGFEQTISQPLMVALMVQLVEPKPSDRMLDVGTGSGYQAAVLSPLVSEVCSVEIVDTLFASASERLREMGFSNVRTRLSDGRQGWSERAPFDAILVAAVTSQIPKALIDQLKPGGRLVLPLSKRDGRQWLTVVDKQPGGEIIEQRVLAVRFVPLTSPRR